MQEKVNDISLCCYTRSHRTFNNANSMEVTQLKSKVLSVRISMDLLVGCYQILELSGMPAKGVKQSSAITSALARVHASLVHEGKLPTYTATDELEIKLQEYTDVAAWAPSQAVGLTMTQPARPGATGLRSSKLEALLERSIQEIDQQEQEMLAAAVSPYEENLFNAGDEDAMPAPLAPSVEDAPKISAEMAQMDMLYQAAESNESMQIAIRIAYKTLPRELWSSPTAERLVLEVHKIFYKEEYNA